MKKWQNPKVLQLALEETYTVSDYITICNWDGSVTYGLGNEEYTDPSQKPTQHQDWVWCKVHGRWHPKDHTGVSES